MSKEELLELMFKMMGCPDYKDKREDFIRLLDLHGYEIVKKESE